MPTQLKIGEFAKLSGVTVKTVLYYHKIGLLPEPVRSAVGYRLYGLDEIKLILAIKRMKSLGLGLDKIKEILSRSIASKSSHEVLVAFQTEILDQIKKLQVQLAKIQDILDKDETSLIEDAEASSSFKMFTDILGEDAHIQYQNNCPELYEQERKLYSVIDELQLGIDYQDLLCELAAYFKEHPEQYQQSLIYGTLITDIADLPQDSPVIKELARDYADYIRSIPFYDKLLNQGSGINGSLESLLSEIFAEALSPAQIKLVELFAHYLTPQE